MRLYIWCFCGLRNLGSLGTTLTETHLMDKVLGQKPTVSGIVPVLIKSITDANELD